MTSSTTKVESTEPPSRLRGGLEAVKLKYIPLPAPLPIDSNEITVTAGGDMHPPCRRCLLDASPGDQVKLIAYDPFPVDSVTPYRGSGPIFVHSRDCAPFSGETLPERQLRRLLSVRAYDMNHMLMASEVVEGSELEEVASKMLADEKASYINVYNAKPGCFAVRVERH